MLSQVSFLIDFHEFFDYLSNNDQEIKLFSDKNRIQQHHRYCMNDFEENDTLIGDEIKTLWCTAMSTISDNKIQIEIIK